MAYVNMTHKGLGALRRMFSQVPPSEALGGVRRAQALAAINNS